jgi:2-oxoisovalerate dehydrogenase E2 component (dihydrolipoyl transacylase)
VDLATLRGTGEGGMVTRDDVVFASTVAASSAPPARREDRPFEETRIPITGVRKHTAAAMVASAFSAPHATVFLTVDATQTMELLDSLRAQRSNAGHRIGLLAVVAKALTIAVRRTPSVNARWDEAAGEIVQFGGINLGIAAATNRGLMVPTIARAHELTLIELADELAALTTAAREGTTKPAALRGGTITITNVGVFGVDAGTPILNPGEAAILAVGAVRRLPWEYHGEIALRDVLTLSLSFDHRLVDGEQGARFLADIGTIIAEPGRALTMM